MSSIIDMSITGLGTIPVQAEYTSNQVLSQYASALSLLVNVFNKTPAQGFSSQDYADVLQGTQELVTLLQNGIVVNGQPTYMTIEMARDVQEILGSLNAVNFFSAAGASVTAQTIAVEQWHDLSNIGLNTIMQSSVNAITSNTSLQALIELHYVKTGNDQIAQKLTTLQTATQVTNDALNLLNSIQGLHNMLAPPPSPVNQAVSAFLSRWETGTQGTFSNVPQAIEAFKASFQPAFNNPIFPILSTDPSHPGTGITPDIRNEYNKDLAQIKTTINQLDTINGTFSGGPNAANRPGTLAANLDNVLSDMGDGSDAAITKWILDGYNQNAAQNTTATAGNFQRRLTDTITAAQSLNDQQRQDLRQELFLFEEFYRSSSDMLSNINTIIERMASNISR